MHVAVVGEGSSTPACCFCLLGNKVMKSLHDGFGHVYGVPITEITGHIATHLRQGCGCGAKDRLAELHSLDDGQAEPFEE